MKYLIILIIIIALYYIFTRNNITNNKLDKKFYNVNEIYPELNKIYDNKTNEKIVNEIKNNIKNNNFWVDWPEQNLYGTSNSEWKVIPFFGFNEWCDENIDKFPETAKFIKNIKGLKTALISKLGPHTKLNEHRGWASLSNSSLRCHYGISVPHKLCFIGVGENEKMDFNSLNDLDWEIKFHEEGKWMVFDDSKYHFASNISDLDRIVLIIDIERPKNVKEGTSESNDTSELKNFINYFKLKNSEYKK